MYEIWSTAAAIDPRRSIEYSDLRRRLHFRHLKNMSDALRFFRRVFRFFDSNCNESFFDPLRFLESKYIEFKYIFQLYFFTSYIRLLFVPLFASDCELNENYTNP